MKKLFNRITEKQARVLTLCLLGAAVVLLGAALWLNLRAGGGGTTLTTYAMGSYIQQTVYGAGAEEAAQQASSAVTELENLISWRVEDSDIATLNQEAGGEFQDIDPQTWDILNTALQVCRPAAGPLTSPLPPSAGCGTLTWSPTCPQASTIESLLPAVDYTQLSLQEDGTAALRSSSSALDLGAVGKGAACDAAVAAYQEAGVERAVVSVGAA